MSKRPGFRFLLLFCILIASGIAVARLWPGHANAPSASNNARGTAAHGITSKASTDNNGDDSDLRYDQVTWLCTHNAFNASDAGFKFANQTYDIDKQLDDGVDALMLDVWLDHGEIVLRHGDAFGSLLGKRPLKDVLAMIRTKLETDSKAILTVIFESYVPADQVASAFERCKLTSFCHVQTADAPWPKLSELRNTNKRLVVFSDRADGGPDWYMPVWDHCFETHWESFTTDDLLINKPGRGDEQNSLFIVNHFLTKPLNQKAVSQTANAFEFVERRFGAESKLARRPSFIVVDFYELGEWDKWTGADASATN